MKVVHIITDLSVGGAEMMLYGLICVSRQDSVEHVVISLSAAAELAQRLSEAGASVKVLGIKPGRPSPVLFVRLARWIIEAQPDVVQTWMYHANLLGGISMCGLRALTRLRVYRGSRPKLFWGLHHTDLRFTGGSRMTQWVSRACALMSSSVPEAIVCCGESTRSSHELAGYCERRMTVIHNGIDIHRFKPQREAREALRRSLALADHVELVGTVGRFHPVKDYGTFVSAIALLRPTRPHCRFVFVGRGLDDNNTEFVSMLRAAEVEDICYLLGPQRTPETIVAGLDVFCLSSSGEGLPTVIGEAMACGVPCVATDVGDTAMLIGETGIVVPPAQPQELATGMVTILSLPDRSRKLLSRAARERIHATFSLEASWRRYHNLYRDGFDNF